MSIDIFFVSDNGMMGQNPQCDRSIISSVIRIHWVRFPCTCCIARFLQDRLHFYRKVDNPSPCLTVEMKKLVAILAPPEGWEPVCIPYRDVAEFIFVPLFKSIAIDDAKFTDFLMDLSVSKFDTVVLTCPTAVRHSINMAIERGLRNRFLTSMSKVEVIVIGDRSAETARWNGLKVSTISPEASTESLIEHINNLPFRGNIALLRSDRGTRTLPTALTDAGWNVTEVPVYSLQLKRSEDMEILLDRLEDKEIDTLAFPTPSHADAFFHHLKERFDYAAPEDMFDGVRIAVLSHETKKKVEDYGLKVDIMPYRATAELLVKEMIKDSEMSYFNR